MSRARLWWVVLLAMVGALLSGLLMLDHYGVGLAEGAVSRLCGEGDDSGCQQVSQSRYSSVGGVSLAGIGVFFYLSLASLLLLSLLSSAEVRTTAGALGLVAMAGALVIDLVLFLLQAFAIEAFCGLCLATYGVNAAAFIVLLPARSAVSGLVAVLGAAEARLALAGWVLASVGVIGFLAMAEYAFAGESAGDETHVLGSPDLEDQLRRSRAEVERLQEILDDRHKYEEYQLDKATREFEQARREELDLDPTPFKGPPQAPIRVVEYSDFLCPYCRSLAGAFSGYLPQSENRVVLYFKNYPLDKECNSELQRTVHPGACEIALGGICAQEQGQFWPYHDRIFSDPPKNPKRRQIVEIGQGMGLDGPRLEACMGSQKAQQRLRAEIREARKVGVNSTPTVLVNGKKLPRVDAFFQAIESESKRLGLPPPRPPQ